MKLIAIAIMGLLTANVADAQTPMINYEFQHPTLYGNPQPYPTHPHMPLSPFQNFVNPRYDYLRDRRDKPITGWNSPNHHRNERRPQPFYPELKGHHR